MDAYDIFKKLSRGAKFTKKPLFETQKSDTIKVEIKDEPYFNDKESKKSNNKKDDSKNDSITLLSTFKNPQGVKNDKKSTKVNDERKKKLLEQEEINHYRNLLKINVVGKEVPEPARNFPDFKVSDDIVENLKKCGYLEPTPVQKQAVPVMLQGRNVLACAPTGSGKTAAFLVPIINDLKQPARQGFRALILCPTRELAKQTQRECLRLSEGRGFRVHVITKIKKALTQYGPDSNQKFDILITTPNRICFLLKQDPPALSLANVEWLVIDEADKLFESGNRGFREQLDQVMNACTNKTKKIAMFSATYTPIVAKWCVRNMRRLIRITIGQRNAATDSVEQELLFVGNEQGKLLALRDLVRKGLNPPVLVFVQSKDRAQQLFNELIYDGINVDAIHADRTQLQRDNTVRCFREGKIWVLICTELMARGIDFKGVNLVINYDFPPSAISYVHRVGRAGRAGRKGKAITFFTHEDTVNLRSIAHILKESGCDVPKYMLTMKKKNKKEKKKLEKAAPKRDDIRTKPAYEIMKENRKRKQQGGGEVPAKKIKSSGAENGRTGKKVKKQTTTLKTKAKKIGKSKKVKTGKRVKTSQKVKKSK